MRLVLSIDGTVLVLEQSRQQLEAYAGVITTLAKTHDICVVTGSSTLAREYIDVGRALGANEIVMVGEWESAEAFQRFIEESDVTEKMSELGVTSEPELYIVEETEAKTSEQPPA